MSSRPYHLHDGKKGAALAVRLTTRASKNEVAEILDDGTVRIRLTASASEGKVNQALVEFLSQVLGVPITKIDIVAGQSGREKLVSILDLDAETVHNRLVAHLA